MRPDRDQPCIEAVMDTWRNWSGAGTWTWAPRTRPTGDAAADLDRWGAAQVAALLEALRPFARVREALLDGPPEAPLVASGEFRWSGEAPHAEFERAVIDAVRTASGPVTTIDLAFDLHVWVRTAASPTMPVRGWVRGLGTASLVVRRADPYGALSVHHTLFVDGILNGDSNAELHRLDQPLLRDALDSLEARLGPIVEVAGVPGVGRTGFASVA